MMGLWGEGKIFLSSQKRFHCIDLAIRWSNFRHQIIVLLTVAWPQPAFTFNCYLSPLAEHEADKPARRLSR